MKAAEETNGNRNATRPVSSAGLSELRELWRRLRAERERTQASVENET